MSDQTAPVPLEFERVRREGTALEVLWVATKATQLEPALALLRAAT